MTQEADRKFNELSDIKFLIWGYRLEGEDKIYECAACLSDADLENEKRKLKEYKVYDVLLKYKNLVK